jgi:hypothetical protein
MDFLSSKIAFTTSGYALAQLKRIKGHNKWINNPQSKEPPRQTSFVKLVQWFGMDKRLHLDIEDFHKDYRLIPYGGNIFGLYNWEGSETFDKKFTLNTNYDGDMNIERDAVVPNPVTFEPEVKINPETNRPWGTRHFPIAIVKFNIEEYKLAKEKHKLYWTWKDNRNEARSELEEQFGYDTKHAMHLVRLLRMGKEALEEGKIIVKRPDAEELLGIRNGSMTYEEVVDYAEYMDDLVRTKLYKTTDLPKKPDLKKVAQLLMNTQYMVWGWKE